MDIDLDLMGPGTDYHGLIQKVAYRQWTQCHNAADWCWREAKRIIRAASSDRYYSYKLGNPVSLHECLEWEANEIKNESPHMSQDDTWYMALDKLADLVMDTACRHSL